MTEQRKLKKLVRERSARTGESYTTARRRVAPTDAPTIPEWIVPGYPGFGTRAHHDSALLAHLLTQAGVTAPDTAKPYSEAMLTGMAGGIGFLYSVFEYAGHAPMLTIVAQHHPQPWLPTALDNLGLPYRERRATSQAKALAELRDVVNSRAVYCTVDRTRLAWHAGCSGLHTDPYGVVVVGAGPELVWLDDDSPAPRELSLDTFASAWSGYAKGRHHSLVIGDAADVPVDLTASIEAAVRLTVAHLTGPVLGNSFDANFGFTGMVRLATQLRDERTKTGWARRFGTAETFALAMRRLEECLEREYTAAGATRPIYAEFLDEAAALLDPSGADALRTAAELFRESGVVWSRMASTAASHGALTDGEAQRAAFAGLADLVDEARISEERAAAALAIV